MDERTEARVLGLISLALAFFGFAAPYKWRDMDPGITDGALILAAILALWAGLILLPASLQGRIRKVLPWVLIVGGPVVGGWLLYFANQTKPKRLPKSGNIQFYIEPVGIKDFDIGGQTEISVKFKNSGNSTAYEATSEVAVGIFSHPLPVDQPFPSPALKHDAKAIVVPGAEIGAVWHVVGIRCGALSGNMKISSQAARSIG